MHTLSLSQHLAPRLSQPFDPKRSLAWAGVIALHGVVLGALLLPREPMVITAPKAEVMPVVFDYERVVPPPKPLDPPPPPPVEIQRIESVRPLPTPTPVPIATPTSVEELATAGPPVISSDPGIEISSSVLGEGGGQANGGAFVSLDYEYNPPPRYPQRELMRGIEGVVKLRVLVGIDGRPLKVEIQESSGSRALDQAALRQVERKWRFRPVLENGLLRQAWGIVPVHFKLD